MKKKTFTALLLAGALLILPIGGNFGGIITSASSNNSSDEDYDFTDVVEDEIESVAEGGTVELTDTNTLSNGMMKALLARNDVTLVLRYTYEGTDYTVVIPAGAAVDDDIPWYGPLYLAGRFGNNPGYAAVANGGAYTVQSGDSLSRIAAANNMTLAQLLAKNPQITNADVIRAGQVINL